MLVQSHHSKAPPGPGGVREATNTMNNNNNINNNININTTYTSSTADIPQNSTLRLSTRLGADEARTAFNEDQVRLGWDQSNVIRVRIINICNNLTS